MPSAHVCWSTNATMAALARTRSGGRRAVSLRVRRGAASGSFVPPVLTASTRCLIVSRTGGDKDHADVGDAPLGGQPMPPAPPPPPPSAPSPLHQGDEDDSDPTAALLFQSLTETPGEGGWSDAHEASVPRPWPNSADLLAADHRGGPQDVEEALEAAVGHEEALDYIESVDEMAQLEALMEGETGDDGTAEDSTAAGHGLDAALFWWRHTHHEDNNTVLRLPDAAGRVEATPHAVERPATAHMRDGASFLSQQDLLFLSYPPRPESLIPPPSQSGTDKALASRRCVMVVYAANDLRVHDHYPLALASTRAQELSVPVVAVCVLDYRTFAQPSLVGGFFRQSPQRAQFLLDTVAALREKLEGVHHVPLLVRCGLPEEHIPRLVVELGAVDVYLTTQYAPHERHVHDAIVTRVREGTWHSRHAVLPHPSRQSTMAVVPVEELAAVNGATAEQAASALLFVQAHPFGSPHPYQHTAAAAALALADRAVTPARCTPHSVWQTTLVHLDDLPTPVAAMKEGERWYHDDVTVAAIRPTGPYNQQVERLRRLPSWDSLLPSAAERLGAQPTPTCRGRLPTLAELGYGHSTDAERARLRDFAFENVIATQSSHPEAGEDAAMARVEMWLTGYDGSSSSGMSSMLRLGRERRTNTKMYSEKLARVSPYLSTGALSPRAFYEAFREYTHANLRDGFIQMQYREALLRLSRRDYWHWMGLRYGARLFHAYGPRPEDTDGVPDWRHDEKITQKWCLGLTGIPFADAAMRELLGTGFVANEGRQALVWLLSTGLGQDWRLAAEWLERCSLDYDPFVCYGNAAYCAQLIPDDFGEPVRGVHYLAHQHDQTGIYVKKWLPQLSKVPPVYIHRPHVLTPRMQAMHGVYLGKNYPYPVKLWHGAQRSSLSLRPDILTALYPNGLVNGPGVGEAARHGGAVMEPEEWNQAVTSRSVRAVAGRAWARAYLPEEVLEGEDALRLDDTARAAASDEEEVCLVHVAAARHGAHATAAQRAVPHEAER